MKSLKDFLKGFKIVFFDLGLYSYKNLSLVFELFSSNNFNLFVFRILLFRYIKITFFDFSITITFAYKDEIEDSVLSQTFGIDFEYKKQWFWSTDKGRQNYINQVRKIMKGRG